MQEQRSFTTLTRTLTWPRRPTTVREITYRDMNIRGRHSSTLQKLTSNRRRPIVSPRNLPGRNNKCYSLDHNN